jgi:TolB-like protein/DNA-binding winged helix-turn-helix (wHTH) protein
MQIPAKRLLFDLYVLDLDRGSLILDGNEIALRPKTFAVLQFLVSNAGRLVSKDELFDAVWPNLAITDDALVQSIGELRRALGKDGARLIKTVPRRGYRFEAPVSVIAPGAPMPEGARDGAAAPVRRATTYISALDIQAGTLRLLALARANWRGGFNCRSPVVLAALGVAILLATGALWLRSESAPDMLGSQRSALPPSKTGDVRIKPAIAILPFVNQSGDQAREYFADGLTQDIISALGRFSELTVMSWNAVLPYKARPANPGDIARNLAVRYQVEGSVQRAGDRVRVTAQLVDAGGRVLWSARYDETLADLFALQDKLTMQVAGAMAIRVTQNEQRRVLAKPTANLEAYDSVLRARPALQRPARASNVEARALLRRAIQLDPNYAAAYAALAETYHIDVSWGWAQSPAATLARSDELAREALRLSDSDVRAHVVLGRNYLFHNQFEQAKGEMERAISINPSDAHALAGRGNILMWLGQQDAAIESLEFAQRIDPELNAIDRFGLSMAYYLKRRYDAAIEQAQLNLRNSESSYFSHVVLAAAYAQLNLFEDAARVVADIRRTDPTFDPQMFGTKFRDPADLEHLRDGLRKAGLSIEAVSRQSSPSDSR